MSTVPNEQSQAGSGGNPDQWQSPGRFVGRTGRKWRYQLITFAMWVKLAISVFFKLVSTPNGLESMWAISGSD